jgi:hypothetical protein
MREIDSFERHVMRLMLQLEGESIEQYGHITVIDSSALPSGAVRYLNFDFHLTICRFDSFRVQHPKARERALGIPIVPNVIGAELYMSYFPGYYQISAFAMLGGNSIRPKRYDVYLDRIARIVDDCDLLAGALGSPRVTRQVLEDVFGLWSIVVVDGHLVFRALTHGAHDTSQSPPITWTSDCGDSELQLVVSDGSLPVAVTGITAV